MDPVDTPVQYLKGVGPKRAGLFQQLGIHTVEDLLYYFPWRYEDRSRIERISDLPLLTAPSDDRMHTLQAKVSVTRVVITPKKGLRIFEAIVDDGTGLFLIKWFNQPFLKDLIHTGDEMILCGPIKRDPYAARLQPRFVTYMENPHYEVMADNQEALHTGRVVPIYHETRGLSSKQIRTLIWDLIRSVELSEYLPDWILQSYHLPPLREALASVHFPGPDSDLATLQEMKTRAHKRFAYEDFFLLALGLAIRKRNTHQVTKKIRWRERPDNTVTASADPHGARDTLLVEPFLSQLPFSLTRAQTRVFDEIQHDMDSPHPMNRLLQGDVGCGKTIIALMAMLRVLENGYQAALMVPTEILAEQHYLNVKGYVTALGVPCWLLTGRMKSSERQVVAASLEGGQVGIVIGTQALLTETVSFRQLGLVVIDEQHKFGVLQRAALKAKGEAPIDTLVMTATPIPRTLSMTLYGDLDISVIDELPPGRLPVSCRHFRESDRWEAYRWLQEELKKGRQGYVVFPLVEESEKLDLKAATEMSVLLAKQIYPEYSVGLLHGRMKREEKASTMAAFKKNEIQVLVATTVIEVGVDVPNATAMIVEHAERFGLAQLHQLRGRVGRGGSAAVCFLVTGRWMTPEAWKRMEAMVKTSDGFKIAEDDLEIRGPGEFLGTRQSGLPGFRVANLLRDVKILEVARRDALRTIEEDPTLSRLEHRRLRQMLETRWQHGLELGTV